MPGQAQGVRPCGDDRLDTRDRRLFVLATRRMDKPLDEADPSVIVLRVSSTNTRDASRGEAFGRLGGCLWLALAVFGFVSAAVAGGVGIDVSSLLLPLTLIPLGAGLIVFLPGSRVSVLLLSTAGGLIYAALGVWNYFRAAEFERANPGVDEVSGGWASLVFILLNVAIAAWSLGAAGLIRRGSGR